MNDFVTSAADLFAAPAKRRFKVVGPLPVLGKKIRIQSLTEGELSGYQAAAVGKEGFNRARMEDANRRLIARCMVDGEGNRLMTDAQAPQLAAWDAMDTSYLYTECAQHVGIKRVDAEELEKNSETIPAGS